MKKTGGGGMMDNIVVDTETIETIAIMSTITPQHQHRMWWTLLLYTNALYNVWDQKVRKFQINTFLVTLYFYQWWVSLHITLYSSYMAPGNCALQKCTSWVVSKNKPFRHCQLCTIQIQLGVRFHKVLQENGLHIHVQHSWFTYCVKFCHFKWLSRLLRKYWYSTETPVNFRDDNYEHLWIKICYFVDCLTDMCLDDHLLNLIYFTMYQSFVI